MFIILNHPVNQRIDGVLSVSRVSSFVNVVESLNPSSIGRRELEGPEESVGLLEMGSNGKDLVNQVFNTNNVVLFKSAFNNVVASNGHSLTIDLSKTTFVNQFSHGLEIGITISNIRFNEGQHLLGSFGKSNKYTVVNLSQSQKSKNFSGLWMKSHGTSDSDNKSQFCLRFQKEVASLFCLTAQSDQTSLCGSVLFDILLCSLEDNLSGTL